MPIGSATTYMKISVEKASNRVKGRRSPITSATGRRHSQE
jgi:hypothetical protein